MRLEDKMPLTLTGFTVLVLSVASLFAGRREMDLVLSLAGLWGLVVLGTTGLASGVSAWLFARSLRERVRGHATRGPLEGMDGVEAPTSFDPGRPGLRLLAASPRLEWIRPRAACRAASRRETRELVTPRGRDAFESIERRWVVEDLFAFWRFAGRVVEERRGLFLPHAGALRASELASCLSRGDLFAHPFGPARGDRVDSRPYTRSDPARLILWKVFARSRELLVRTPESARSPEERPLVYLLAGAKDEAAAGAARVLWESALLGEGARFACAGHPEPCDDSAAVLRAIARSSRFRRRALEDLRALLASTEIDADDPVLLLCSAQDAEQLEGLLRVVASDPARFVVLAAGDAGTPRGETRWWRALFRDDESRRDPDLGEMKAALAPLARSGARTVLADRVSGSTCVLAEGESGENLWQSA